MSLTKNCEKELIGEEKLIIRVLFSAQIPRHHEEVGDPAVSSQNYNPNRPTLAKKSSSAEEAKEEATEGHHED